MLPIHIRESIISRMYVDNYVYWEAPKMKSLSSICVSCVAEHFKKMVAAYSSGKGIWKNHFMLLQRRYSTALLQEVLKNGPKFENNETYVQFLFNQYLKEVNLCTYIYYDATVVIEQVKKIAKTITSLDLSLDRVYLPLLEHVSVFNNVETLILDIWSVSEDLLRSIRSNCCSLKTFNLPCCQTMNDKRIKAFCFPHDNVSELTTSNKMLQHLNIGHLTSRSITLLLRNFPNLLSLMYGDILSAINELHFDDTERCCVSDLEKYNLEILKIINDKPYSRSFIEMYPSIFPYIKHLEVYSVHSQRDIDTLSKFASLKEVHLGFLDDYIDLSPFLTAKGKDLEGLEIEGRVEKILPLNLINCLPNVIRLGLRNIGFSTMNERELSFQPLIHLRKFAVGGIDFPEEINARAVEHILSRAHHLEVLNIYTCDLPSEFVRAVTSMDFMKSLKTLSLYSTTISPCNADKFLKQAQTLKVFDWQYYSVIDDNYSDNSGNYSDSSGNSSVSPDDCD